MARVIQLKRHDGEPIYVSPESLTFVTPSIALDHGVAIGTSDGSQHTVLDPIDQIVNAWKD